MGSCCLNVVTLQFHTNNYTLDGESLFASCFFTQVRSESCGRLKCATTKRWCHTQAGTSRASVCFNFSQAKLVWMYTSGQRYGITTTKWHLREFDWHLLFLVVCSIAERNTVDFIDPLHNQIEWPNSQYCGGTSETQVKEKNQFRGSHLKWSLLSHYHFNALCSVGFW